MLRGEMEERVAAKFDLTAHLERQSRWSLKTFGPGARTVGVCEHIIMEIREINARPHDVMEWIDIIILSFDGALRGKLSPCTIASCMAVTSFNVPSTGAAYREIYGYRDAALDGNPDAFLDLAGIVLGELERQGWPREAVWMVMAAKQMKNEARKWPDWRDYGQHEAIMHIRRGT
jgi:hypothetical protein